MPKVAGAVVGNTNKRTPTRIAGKRTSIRTGRSCCHRAAGGSVSLARDLDRQHAVACRAMRRQPGLPLGEVEAGDAEAVEDVDALRLGGVRREAWSRLDD